MQGKELNDANPETVTKWNVAQARGEGTHEKNNNNVDITTWMKEMILRVSCSLLWGRMGEGWGGGGLALSAIIVSTARRLLL